jgi:hypothetical protein
MFVTAHALVEKFTTRFQEANPISSQELSGHATRAKPRTDTITKSVGQ